MALPVIFVGRGIPDAPQTGKTLMIYNLCIRLPTLSVIARSRLQRRRRGNLLWDGSCGCRYRRLPRRAIPSSQ